MVPVRILTRYILREVLAYALIGTALFTFVIFISQVTRILELVVRNSAPLPSAAEIFFFTLPTAFTFTLPMGALVGILIGLSRLAADSEVTAIRASGLGAGMFVRVIAIFALTVWLLAFANNLLVAPRSAAALAALQNSLKSSQASFEVQPRVFYEDFKNYVLYVQDSTTGPHAAMWKNVFLADVSTASAPKITVAAEAVAIPESQNRLRLHLENGAQHETVPRSPDQYTISIFDETDLPIPLSATDVKQRGNVPVAELSTSELLARSRSPDAAAARWYGIEFHRRLAWPAACLVLAMVGIPLGISAKKGGKSTGFVLTFVLVFAYYFASLLGVAMARQNKVPPALGVWLANILFAIVGLALLWRVERMPPEAAWLHGWGAELSGKLRRWLEPSPQRAKDRLAGGPGLRRTLDRATLPARRFSARFPLILDDYILRDFATYLALVLGAFLILTLVFSFFELLNDIIRNRVPLITVGEYLLNVSPSMIYQMTPLSVLIAVLVTFGLMQKANEITAMKATGISLYRTMVPVLLLSAALAAGLFFFDQLYLPYANKRQEVLRNTIKGRPAQTYLHPDRKWIFGQHSTIYYYEFFDPDRNRFAGLSAFEFDPRSFQLTRRIYAAGARWEEALNKWVLEQGWERSFRGEAIDDYRRFEVATFDRLNEPPTYFKKTGLYEVKPSSEMNAQELGQYIRDLQQSGFEVARLRVQLYKKFAYPLITLVMAVLATAFALSAGRRGALAGVAVAIAVAIGYFLASGLFEAMGNLNQLPAALAAWAPDIIFGLAGGYLALKVPT